MDLPDHDQTFLPEGPVLEEEPFSIFAFPRGAKAGSLLHEVFEGLDFMEKDQSVIKRIVDGKLGKYGYEKEWGETVEKMIGRVLAAPLQPGADGLTLSRIGKKDRLTELEFYLNQHLLQVRARLQAERDSTLAECKRYVERNADMSAKIREVDTELAAAAQLRRKAELEQAKVTQRALELDRVLVGLESHKADLTRQEEKLRSDRHMLALRRAYLKAGRDQLEKERTNFTSDKIQANSDTRQFQRRLDADEKLAAELRNQLNEQAEAKARVDSELAEVKIAQSSAARQVEQLRRVNTEQEARVSALTTENERKIAAFNQAEAVNNRLRGFILLVEISIKSIRNHHTSKERFASSSYRSSETI